MTEYAFRQSFNDLDNEDFFSGLPETIDALLSRVHVVTHLPRILITMMATPEWFQGFLNPGMVVIRKYLEVSMDMNRSMSREIFRH